MITMLLILFSLVIFVRGLSSLERNLVHSGLNPMVTIHELHSMPSALQEKRSRKLRTEVAPLYPGYGTHYVYAYIGTPPQRQSLIIDTGSATTAFPCKGCNNCGTHTDVFFDIRNSSTAVVPKCAPNPNCPVGQTYGEGSSWHGFKVSDKLWIGDSEIGLIPGASKMSTDFNFACQQQLTGLFRSQLADGILGLANVPESLPLQLFTKNITTSRIFALCYRVGGGILTLGGIDPAVHHHHSVSMAKLDKRANGGYGVLIQYLRIRELKTKIDHNVTALPSQYLGTTGAIINSGSTNTYLPNSLAKAFEAAFAKASHGIQWSSNSIALTEQQINQLPEIIFGLMSPDNKNIIEISMPISNYLESIGNGKYTFRLFFTSTSGTILGANFLMGYNVMFDVASNRIGFSKSTCNYEEVAPVLSATPTTAPTTKDGSSTPQKCDPQVLVPYTSCSAYCTRNESAYRVQGSQDYMNECRDGNVIAKTCYENCSYHRIARGPIPCLDQPWSECTHGCIKSRLVVPVKEEVLIHGKCNYRSQTATCYSGLCPRQEGDYILYIDMRVRIEPYRWSYVHTEYFYAALSSLLKIYIHNIEMLHGTGNEYAAASKLHFQIRLKAKDYSNSLLLHDAAEKLIEKCRRNDFGGQLLNSLIEISSWWEGEDNNRFGWLFPTDVEVLSAVAIPIGDTRDPFGLDQKDKRGKNDDDDLQPTINTFGYFLLGIAVAAIIIIIILLFLHFRLREEYALLSKDKSSLSKSSQTLRKLWGKLASFAKRQFGGGSGGGEGGSRGLESSSHLGDDFRVVELSRIRKEQDQALSRMGLMHGTIGDDDEILSDDGN